ncbi:MAG: hypothetical protein ACOY94_13765 [Bacillota bacterium]
MVSTTTIANLLRSLVGTGFNVSLIVDGVVIENQKVVAVQSNIVFTVNAAGVVRATLINQIDSVNF